MGSFPALLGVPASMCEIILYYTRQKTTLCGNALVLKRLLSAGKQDKMERRLHFSWIRGVSLFTKSYSMYK